MKILVTGSAGFMGSHLVDALIKKKHQVFGIDDLSGGYKRNVNPKSVFFKQDLREKEKTARIIEKIKPQLLFHLAADATEGRSQFTPIECTERGYLAYLNTLVPAIRQGVKRVVFTSSMSVYGSQKPPFSEDMPRKPDDIYGIAKASQEAATEVLSEVYGFEYCIVRPHNVYGPRQNMADPYRNVIAIFINSLLRDKNFYIYGDGKQKRAFTCIDDFTPYFVKTGFQKNCHGQIINIGPRKEYTINQMAKTVLEKFFDGKKVPKRLRPKYLPDRPKEVKLAYSTDKKAKKLLGFKHKVSLEEGIKEMVEWAREIGPQEPRYMESLEIETIDAPKTWRKKLI